MIQRQACKTRWHAIAPEPIADTSLSWQARGLLVYLLSKPDDWEVCIDQLVNASEKDGRHTVQAILRELADAGYATLQQRRDETGHRATGKRWSIAEISDRPKTGLSETASNGAEFSDRAKSRQSETLTVRKSDPTYNGFRLSIEKEPIQSPAGDASPVSAPVESPPPPLSKVVYSPGFEVFWQTWPPSPRKTKKLKTFAIWKRLGLERQAGDICQAVERWKPCDQWVRGYEPMPSTWLRDSLYEEEPPATSPPSPVSVATVEPRESAPCSHPRFALVDFDAYKCDKCRTVFTEAEKQAIQEAQYARARAVLSAPEMRHTSPGLTHIDSILQEIQHG
jgi:hypothetical protein